MDVEEASCLTFIQKFYCNYETAVPFNIASLEEAKNATCFSKDFSSRRVLLLYFHNNSDQFSKDFCSYLNNKDVIDLINDSFYVLAWDITTDDDHEILMERVKQAFDIEIISDFIFQKKSAIFFITTIATEVTVLACMHGSLTLSNLKFKLQQIIKAMEDESRPKEELPNISENNESTEIGSTRFQQIMYDQLGDRDYDCFEFNEHEPLKRKIGFSLYGPPKSTEGYDAKENNEIEVLYEKIRLVNNEHSKWNDRIIISFIYNCTEPLPEVKLERSKNNRDYNPLSDITPVPIFVLRKCKTGSKPCRVFICHDARVYQSWEDYLKDNKLPKCVMMVPRNGRYEGNNDGAVLLEKYLSPACELAAAVLQKADLASTALGLTSGGVFLAAMIPAVTMAPIAITAAGIAGAGVGMYSLVRSSFALFDRSSHRESISVTNSDARGAYINIVAGSLGFVGAGASAAVSSLSARGINISKETILAVNTINSANIAAGGVGLVNSTYEVMHQIIVERQTPSALTILQLSSSVLFFGNAVYNFRSAGTIIEESQTRTLNEIQDSLRSNRHRKTFNKLLKETMRQSGSSKGKAEVIATIKNMNQRDEVLAVLTRSNKNFNRSGIKFSAQNGNILLNGVMVDIQGYGNMQSSTKMQFHLELPPIPETFTDADKNNITTNIINTFKMNKWEDILFRFSRGVIGELNFEQEIFDILSRFTGNIQQYLINMAKMLLDKLDNHLLNRWMEMSAEKNMLYSAVKVVIGFIQEKVDEMEEAYQTEKLKAQEQPYFDEREFNEQYSINPSNVKRTLYFFEKVLDIYFSDIETAIRKLMNYFRTQLTLQICESEKSTLRKEKRHKHQSAEKSKCVCKVCSGYFYT